MFVQGNPNLGHSDKSFFRMPCAETPDSVQYAGPARTTSTSRLPRPSRSTSGSMRNSGRTHSTFSTHTQWNGAQTTYPYASVGNVGNIPSGQATGAREARILQVGLKLAF
jgi:hypothetical protein